MKATAELYAMPRNLVLAASAGTGKTHALVGVVVHMLLGARAGGAVDPARIVATTFSRKAASEIRARVRDAIETLARTPDASVYAAGLREALGGRASDAELSRRAKRALARLPQARFGTLHGFATGIVQRYAVELGLGPGFELATEADAQARAEDAIARALEARLSDSTDAIQRLVEAAGGIDALVATLRRLLVQLEEDGRSARDLVIDPTDAEAAEAAMRELVLHARAISSHPRAEEVARELGRAWDAGDEERIARAAQALTSLRASRNSPPELESFFAFRDALPGKLNPDKGLRLARTWRARHTFGRCAGLVRDVLASAEREIEDIGRARASLGFGEVLRAARELLATRPEVADEVGAGIEALLVDEFQDTSRVQRDLVALLWARPDARPSSGAIPPLSAVRGAGLLVVGDRKQSIYGFRGADVGVFAELAVGLAGAPAREALGIPRGVAWEPPEPTADFHALRHNRRSVPSILAFANAFSARRFQTDAPTPELFEIAYVPETEDLLVPPERAGDEGEAAAPATTWLRITPVAGSSTKLDEAFAIAERIDRIVREGAPKLGRDGRAPSYRDVAVLAATNDMLDAVAFTLAQAGVPYVVAGKGFFRTRETSDLAAMLTLVLDPSDRLAALEVLRGPWASVHDETLLGLVEPGKGLVPPSRWTAPPTPELIRSEDRAALEALASLVASLGRCANRLGAGELLREAASACGLEHVLAAMPRGEQRVANVRKLLAIADRHPDARAFHAWLEEAKERDTSESEAATFSDGDDAVRLLTVHASKGLDFPIVFVPQVSARRGQSDGSVACIALGSGDRPNVLSVRAADESGLPLDPPSLLRARRASAQRVRAEKQRLAYVAVTRAVDAMFFVGGWTGKKALDPGDATLGALEEIGPEVLTVEDVAPPPVVLRAAEGTEQVGPLAVTGGETPPLPEPAGVAPAEERRAPAWRTLPLAPTALADFAHCARRFELIHVLGLPEHARGARPVAAEEQASFPLFDARAQGTLAHAALERIAGPDFLDPERAGPAVAAALAAAGVPVEHPQHGAIAGRALRFLQTEYVRALADRGGAITREAAFVLPVEDARGRAVTLRGSMDLVVAWPDGDVDVVDYKSARSGDPEQYAFQLDVYALAARARFPEARALRVGVSFLGGGAGEPVWREVPPEAEVRARIGALGAELVAARWREAFPRVAIARCEAIHCGFIGRCHPDR